MFFKKNEKLDEIIDRVYRKNRIARYLNLILGCTLMAVSFNLCFLPTNIVHGGVAGVSIIFKDFIDTSLFIFIASMILLLVSYFTLGWEKTKGSIAGSIIFPICVKLTADLGTYIDFNIDNLMLLVILGSVVGGLGAGLNFKSGFSTGGTDIINQIISKYAKVSIGKAMLMSDGIIVIVAGFFLEPGVTFAWTNVIYAVMSLYIISIMSDKVILGISRCKAFYIVTECETSVKKFILTHLSHGATVLDGRGAYTGNHQKVIMCIIPTKDYFLAKDGILEIDPNAFFLVTDAYEVSGGSLKRR